MDLVETFTAYAIFPIDDAWRKNDDEWDVNEPGPGDLTFGHIWVRDPKSDEEIIAELMKQLEVVASYTCIDFGAEVVASTTLSVDRTVHPGDSELLVLGKEKKPLHVLRRVRGTGKG